jgi:hypothetical protein
MDHYHTHILSGIQFCIMAFSPLTLLFPRWTPRRWDFIKQQSSLPCYSTNWSLISLFLSFWYLTKVINPSAIYK